MTIGLARGSLLPPFSLPAANREGSVSLWDYKPRHGLALLFLPAIREYKDLLETVSGRTSEYHELSADVLVVSPEPPEWLRNEWLRNESLRNQARATMVPVLWDQDNKLRRQCLGDEPESPPRAHALIADRWGEVHGSMLLQPGEAGKNEEELRKWLEFLERQCNECFPPEWPAS